MRVLASPTVLEATPGLGYTVKLCNKRTWRCLSEGPKQRKADL